MHIPQVLAQWFSDTLLRIYAARSGGELATLQTHIPAHLVSEQKMSEWINTLLRSHVDLCRQNLAAGRNGTSEPAELTRREREVLHRVALGETDKAIGAALGISPKTASKHVENILRKLGVETRTAAVASGLGRKPVSHMVLRSRS